MVQVYNILHGLDKKVQVGKDQEKAQSEKDKAGTRCLKWLHINELEDIR